MLPFLKGEREKRRVKDGAGILFIIRCDLKLLVHQVENDAHHHHHHPILTFSGCKKRKGWSFSLSLSLPALSKEGESLNSVSVSLFLPLPLFRSSADHLFHSLSYFHNHHHENFMNFLLLPSSASSSSPGLSSSSYLKGAQEKEILIMSSEFIKNTVGWTDFLILSFFLYSMVIIMRKFTLWKGIHTTPTF